MTAPLKANKAEDRSSSHEETLAKAFGRSLMAVATHDQFYKKDFHPSINN